ncbi:G-protein coupled receptor 55 [Ornithorhynchus anatinus]|uniref:G protein-coupled receptor 55 n=1 Tax=Ornithorhynchus anatinus TaxID=9258 RepID=F7FNN4_ORNAN|nr:G-protein coupled receptor 55 [Ornithorhynchus anatinus]
MNQSNPPQNCSFDSIDINMDIVRLVIYIPTFILGLILNVLAVRVFWSLCRENSDHSTTYICMINLAIFDLQLLVSLLFRMVLAKKFTTNVLCTIVECLYFVSMYGSVFTIVFISFDRYIRIKYPFWAHHSRTPKTSVMVCCCIWVVVWVGSIPIYDFHPTGNVKCFHNMSRSSWETTPIVCLELFGFVIPLAVVSYCSFHSIVILLQDNTAIQKRACIWTIVINFGVFVASFLPVHLGIFLQFLVKKDVIQGCTARQAVIVFLQLMMCFANVNCCLDVFCYYFVAKEFIKGAQHQGSSIFDMSRHLSRRLSASLMTGSLHRCTQGRELEENEEEVEGG